MLGSTCIHPIDLVKVRVQLSTDAKPSALKIAQRVISTEGVKGLYSGLSASLTRQATYGTARIGLHRTFSNKLVEYNDGKPIGLGLKTLSGLTSGAIAVCIGTPFDVSLVRMQNDGAKPLAQRLGYRNVFDALARIAKEEGVTALWSGLAPNILRGMAMNVGMMASYDQAKESIIEHITHDPDSSVPSLETKLMSSAVAGFTCAFFSLPFDMLKSRLQSMRIDPATGKMPYRGVVDCFTQILRNEGVLTFWRGFLPYYGRSAPHAMIILLSVEQITSMYSTAFGLESSANMVTAGRFTSTGSMPNALTDEKDIGYDNVNAAYLDEDEGILSDDEKDLPGVGTMQNNKRPRI